MASILKKHNFNLISFDSKSIPQIEINGDISRIDNKLNIEYVLKGKLSTIIIPQGNKTFLRQYDLWEHTCFEFFLKLKGTAEYWEFNLSPSGDWNVFHFLNYRLNIAEEKAFNSLPFTIFQDEKYFKIEINLDLNAIGIADRDLDVAITAVVENKDRQLSYWALTHPYIEADFHHQDSFILSV